MRAAPLLLLIALAAGAAEPRRTPTALLVPPPSAIPRSEPPPRGETIAPIDEGPDPEARAPATQRRLRITVFPFPAPGIGEDVMVPLLRGLNDAFLRNDRLDMRELDARLADFAQEVPVDQVDLARATLQQGAEALRRLEMGRAIQQLQGAVDQLIVVLPYVKKQELADAMMTLAVAQAQKGSRRASNATLIRLLTWRNDYQLDQERFPPGIAGPLEEARRAVARLAKGSLRLSTDPPGAQAFVDGQYVGVTPTVVEGLRVGEHFVTLRKIGYKRGVRVAQVSARVPQTVQARLQQSEKYLLVKQAMDRLGGAALGARRLDPVVDTLRDTLYLDHAVFLGVAPVSAAAPRGPLKASAYLYDLRTRQLLERQEMTFGSAEEGELRTDELAQRLYAHVDYDNSLKAPPEPPPPPVAVKKSIYKKWWFWTAAGVIAAGVAAIGAGVAASRPAGCPDGNVCTGLIQY